MKDHLRQLLMSTPDPGKGLLLTREYLQALILKGLQENGVFTRWGFIGGTALRFLYSIPRFSEDLDFSLLSPATDAGFKSALKSVKQALIHEGYTVDVTIKEDRVVASSFIRFPGLPCELGLTPDPRRSLSIKVELDTNPPVGAGWETTLIRRHLTLNLYHHDKASLLAGKIHALLSRPWTKGRDLFDLAWYLTEPEWPSPNLELLNAALAQSTPGLPLLADTDWKNLLLEKLAAINWNQAREDVLPFLEREADMQWIAMEAIGKLLEKIK